MCLAQHLAVLDGSVTSFTPCCNVVGIHLVEFLYAITVIVMTNSAVRAVRQAFLLRLDGLLLIHLAHRILVKQSHVKQLGIFTTTKHTHN